MMSEPLVVKAFLGKRDERRRCGILCRHQSRNMNSRLWMRMCSTGIDNASVRSAQSSRTRRDEKTWSPSIM